jgi:hypothetical protein
MQTNVSYFYDGLSENRQSDILGPELTALLASPDSLALGTAFSRMDDSDLRRAVVHLVEQLGRRNTG